MKCVACRRKLADWNELTKSDLYRNEIGIPYSASNEGLVLCCNNPNCTNYNKILIRGFDFNYIKLWHIFRRLSINAKRLGSFGDITKQKKRGNMMQNLVMPFVKQMMLCGYKNSNYRKHWGFDHYGVDISTYQGDASSDHTIYASGSGKVIACGWDNSGGNVVVVLYPAVYNHKIKSTCDLVARYMHLASIAVKSGQEVQAGCVLGMEGKTQTGDYHLHIELDTDTKWALYSPQVGSKDDKLTAAQGNILKKGTDTTVNPSDIFHVSTGQVIVPPTYNPAWLNTEDKRIPTLTPEDTAVLQRRITALEAKLRQEQGLRINSESCRLEMMAELQAVVKKFML